MVAGRVRLGQRLSPGTAPTSWLHRSKRSSLTRPATVAATGGKRAILGGHRYADARSGVGSRRFARGPGLVMDGTACERLESQVELVGLKEKMTLSREDAAARLHAIADELGSNNDVVIERENMRFVAHVPDQVHLKVEFEIENDGTELEIEPTW